MEQPQDSQTGGRAAPPPDEAGGSPAPRRALLDKSPRFADSFGLVLVLLIVSYFIVAVAGGQHYGRIASLLTFATTTWLALRAAQVKRRSLRLARALIPVATVLAIVLILIGSDSTAKIVSASLTGLLVVVAPIAILKRLVAHPVINLNTFYGAVCVYLLIAMAFATSFALISLISGTPFFAQVATPNQIDYLYFSFTTITTVGYGDLTAATSVGRMTAVLEAVLGQLYLITVVALVVQNLGQARRREASEDAGEGDSDGSRGGD